MYRFSYIGSQFYSRPAHISVLMPVPHCFDCCSSVVSFGSCKVWVLQFCSCSLSWLLSVFTSYKSEDDLFHFCKKAIRILRTFCGVYVVIVSTSWNYEWFFNNQSWRELALKRNFELCFLLSSKKKKKDVGIWCQNYATVAKDVAWKSRMVC